MAVNQLNFKGWELYDEIDFTLDDGTEMSLVLVDFIPEGLPMGRAKACLYYNTAKPRHCWLKPFKVDRFILQKRNSQYVVMRGPLMPRK